MSTVKLTMFEVLEKFLMDPERKGSFMALRHDDAMRDMYLSVPRDAPHAVVDPGPSDIKRLESAEKRAAERIATQQVGNEGTKTMVTQMYLKAGSTAELQDKLKGKVEQNGDKGPRGPRQ